MHSNKYEMNRLCWLCISASNITVADLQTSAVVIHSFLHRVVRPFIIYAVATVMAIVTVGLSRRSVYKGVKHSKSKFSADRVAYLASIAVDYLSVLLRA